MKIRLTPVLGSTGMEESTADAFKCLDAKEKGNFPRLFDLRDDLTSEEEGCD